MIYKERTLRLTSAGRAKMLGL